MWQPSKASRTGLWLTEKDVEQDLIPKTPAWGQQWLQTLSKYLGINHAWLGLIDEVHSVRWVASLSPEPVPLQFIEAVRDDTLAAENVFTFRDHLELVSGGLFPLIQDEQILGFLGILSEQTDYFKAETNQWIRTLVEIITDGLATSKSQNKEQQAEYAIARILQSCLDVREALPAVLEILAGVLEADAVTALRYNTLPRRFELLMTHGLENASLAKLNLHFDFGLVRRTFENRFLWIEDLRKPPLELVPISQLKEVGFLGYLAVPLVAHGQLVGAVEVAWRGPKHVKTWDQDFLERVTEQLAFVLERTDILRDFREKNSELVVRYNAMIEGLSRALELRDLETEGHTRRVSLLTIKLVEHMQIPVDQWDAIRLGALLHDIGKIGIPDAILLKPGSLTAREKKVMQQHVIYGYNILAPIINTQHALDIALYHHERWDGEGYPHGLQGERIPMVARLFAVVDVFDALSSDRPYRPAWSRTQVLEYLKQHAGSQFDPQVVKSFLEVAEAGI